MSETSISQRSARRPGIVVLVVATFLIASCGSDGPSSTATSDSSPVASVATTTSAVERPTASTEADATPPAVSGATCLSPLPVDAATTTATVKVAPGVSISIAVCRDHGDGASGVYGLVPSEASEPTEWRSSASPFAPDGVALDGPIEIDGVPGVEYFLGDLGDGTSCALFVVRNANDWRELCFLNAEPSLGPVFTVINGKMTVFDLTDPAAPTGRLLDGAMWGSSGCSFDQAESLVAAVHRDNPMLAFTGLRCEGDRASLRAGSVLLQPGPADGLIMIFEREGAEWVLVDAGTGIDEFFPHDVPPEPLWSSWPAATNPQPSAIDFSSTIDPTTADLDEMSNRLAAAVGDAVGGDAAPVVLDGFWASEPLVVISTPIVEDDSVSGQLTFVWLTAQYDDSGVVGFAIEAAYDAFECSRGVTPDGDLCV